MAKGLVADVRSLVEKHDFFRRLQQAKEVEAAKHREVVRAEAKRIQRQRAERHAVLKEIQSLATTNNPQSRGKQFEKVMNRLFEVSGILVREAFELIENPGQGISEQVDGAIELDGHIYVVEMKWQRNPVDVDDVSRHIGRVLTRTECRGLFISASGYTKSAVSECKQAMKYAPIVLCKLEEIVRLLEAEDSVSEFLKSKAQKLIIEKQPLAEVF